MEERQRSESLDALVGRARQGDREALEELVRTVQDDIYNLAVRMLLVPEDAQDATQEILVRVVTHLGSFRGESSFRTWAYRVASNYLRDVRKSSSERRELTFTSFGAGLREQVDDWLEGKMSEASGKAGDGPNRPLLLREMRLGCTQAMLLCLPREQRVAFILADVFQVSGEEGAAVLEITPAAFRKRASRAREALRGFLDGHCGLVNPDAFCRCEYRLAGVIERGFIDPEHLRWARAGASAEGAAVAPLIEAGQEGLGGPARRPVLAAAAEGAKVEEWHELDRVAALYRGAPRYPAPERFIGALRELLDSGRHRLLN